MTIPSRVALALSLFLALGARAATSPETIATRIQSSAIDAAHAVHVQNITLHDGAATITLIDGTVFPATAIDGRPVEAVFLGRGTFAMKPDDPIEAGQLDLFTAKRELNEPFTEAVFVAAGAEPMTALTKGTPSTDATAAARAQKLFGDWKSGAERKLLNVDSALFAALVGDEGAGNLFVARIHSNHAGDFDYVADPTTGPGALLGQFVPLDLTARERRRAEGQLNKEHQRGRSLGTEITDLGNFNVWSVIGARSAEGDFEPDTYHIDATVAPGAETLSGKTTMDLRAVHGGHRVVSLALDGDEKVSQVTDAGGAPLVFVRSGYQLAVVLPAAPEAGKHLSINVAFEGAMFDKEGRDFRLRDTVYWYPHLGSVDHAKYDVTLHWPAGLDLLCPGKRVDGGDHWEKRVLDLPANGYTFEIGHFSIETIQAGHVNIRLAFDPESEDRRQVAKSLSSDTGRRNAQIDFRARGITKQGRDEIRQQLRDSLVYYESLFGPYPLDELTVVTVPRDFSQGLPGFISLSTDMMTDPGTEFLDAFRASVDRRLVVAHEVAHQWWGDLVSWTSPRDQWIGEAMASYAAGEYSRQKLDWSGRFQIGFTTRWPTELMRSEHGSRPIESLGPLVLGERLTSSRSPWAYVWITYAKGALVMNMLSDTLGEQKFHSILRDIVTQESQKVLSTEGFLGYLTRESGRDLRPFSNYFIYGSGVPEIEYQTEVRPNGGKWTIHISGERTDPWRYRVRVVKRDDGKFDVVREAVPSATAPFPSLLVPLQVALEDRTNRGQSVKYAKKLIDVSDAKFAIDIDIPWQPKDVVLDRDHEVLALLYSEAHNRKEVLLQRGTNLAAAGKPAEAEKTFREGLAAKRSTELEQALNRYAPGAIYMPPGVDFGHGWKDPLLDIQNQLTDSALHLSLARLFLDQGKDAAAADELKQANKAVERDWRDRIDAEVSVLQSRVDLHSGAYKSAFDRLSKVMKDADGIGTAEEYAMLAVAAKQSGDTTELAHAVDQARVLGVDLSGME